MAADPVTAEGIANGWAGEARLLTRWGLTQVEMKHGVASSEEAKERSVPIP